MKKYFRLFVALALILSLTSGFMVRAYAQEVEIRPIAPLSENIIVSEKLQATGPMPDDSQDYKESISAAAEVVRQGFMAREAVVTVGYVTTDYNEQLMYDVFYRALEHTGVPTQGDYLRWQLGECELGVSGYSYGSEYYLTLTYTPEYYTTIEQEAQMDLAVNALLDQLNVYDATDYEKVCAIYDYICENVTYDHLGLQLNQSKLIYTAYAALINGKAVCQGYANLFYRLALELNVDARLIAGVGNKEDHGWNIVKLDGQYYALDATWDATRAQNGQEYDYFLLCEEHFDDHVRDPEYLTTEFQEAYPMANKDYSPLNKPVLGDIDGSETVNSDDVIYLLLHVTMPDQFQISAKADFTGDGFVTSDDVIYLLLHVTMPDQFPLQQ